MTSRFSFSTTNSSPTCSTYVSSPAFSPALTTSSTLSSNAYLTLHHDNRRTPRWQPLSQDGLPRSSSSSMTRSHRFHSPGTTPVMSSSPSPRRFTPPATTAAAAATACPAQPAPAVQPCSASPSPESCNSSSNNNNNNNTPRDALGIEEAESGNKKRNKNPLGRVGRSMGRGLRQCSGFFKRRPDAPDEVEQVPRPMHWSEM